MVNRRKRQPLQAVFGVNVRLERTRQGLTQEEVAGRIDRAQAYVSQIEAGKLSITLETVDRIADALGVQRANLLDESLGRKEG